MVSIVVSSYGRTRHMIRLVESAEIAFRDQPYEIIAVCSDHPESEKVQWLKSRPEVNYVQADIREEKRLQSLYVYENMGIKMARYPWVFITNDDTRLHENFFEEFQKVEAEYDVILVKGHIGDISAGPVIPQIGELKKGLNSEHEAFYLYDFTIIRKSMYEEIGYLDENLDWFGKGMDLALTIEFKTKARILRHSEITVDHFMALTERNPPDFRPDFAYLKNKWNSWCQENPGYVYRTFR